MVLRGSCILRYSILLIFLLSCIGVASSSSLTPVVTEYGKISISVDGLGTSGTGIIQVEKPTGTTVRGAYLMASGTPSSQIANGSIKLEDTGINWDIEIFSDQSSTDWYNYWADVTSVVQPIVDSAPAGRVNINVDESVNANGIDGEVLAVIFNDPNQADDNTVILLFGGQDPAGDSFEIGLSDPINKSNSNLAIDMGLAISYSYQPGPQVSLVDVNGQRLTSSAGGQDDGAGSNGQLITVGGLDDSNSNPADPSLSNSPDTRYDDELYNLLPLVSNGDTNITVFTQNPTNDDNIFFSYFFMKSTTAIVGEGIILSPSNATVFRNTQHTLTASLQDDNGDPISNKNVTFTVISGPHNGTTVTNTTDSNGETTFSYTGTSVGVDTVKASFVGSGDEMITSNQVNVGWITPQYSEYIEFIENGNSTYAASHSTIVNITNASVYNQSLQYSWDQNSSIGAIELWKSFNNSEVLTKDSVSGDWYLHIKALDDASNINYSVSNVFKLDNGVPVYDWVQKVLTANTGENITIEINATDNIEISFANISVDGLNHEMESSGYFWNISIPASDSGTLVSSIIYNCTFIDLAGNTNTTEDVTVDVSILPVANFTVDATRGISPLNVNFHDDSSGLVESWYWDFGDGNTSTDQNPTHEFDSGNFTVNLTVSNGNGTSSKHINIRAAQDPVYTYSPEESEMLSIYRDGLNFSIQSSLFSSYRWFINDVAANGTGITLYNNTDDSAQLSYCMVNSSQYINQADFFMGVYNISVQTSNESIGRTDIHSWQWTVTNSSATDREDIDIMINTTPQITVVGSEKCLRFNTTNDDELDDNGLVCSIIGTSLNTFNNTDGIQIKVEVLNMSLINESTADFSMGSVYQYLDISFNNETLVNDGSNNRSIEFRVLNEKGGGALIVNTVYLRHWNSSQWEAYTSEFTVNDGTYSYFIVRNVSGFSPFAVTCDYSYSSGSASISQDGIPAYIKWLMFKEKAEDAGELEDNEVSENTATFEEETETNVESNTPQTISSKELPVSKEENNFSFVYWIMAIGLVIILGIVVWRRKKDDGGL